MTFPLLAIELQDYEDEKVHFQVNHYNRAGDSLVQTNGFIK